MTDQQPVPQRALQVLVWLVLAAGLLLISVNPAQACEPCMEILGLEDTIARSDLVIVGQKVQEGPTTGSGPDWITVHIDQVLKGSPDGARIQVNSWDGMCNYGIDVDRASYIMFMEQRSEMWDTVNQGCSVHKLPVVDGEVQFEDGETASVAAFAAQYGLAVEDVAGSEPAQDPPDDPAVRSSMAVATALGIGVLCVVLAGGGLLAAVLLRRARQNQTED